MVEIRDAQGTCVQTCEMRGGSRVFIYVGGWGVPSDLKGEFTAVPKYDTKPFAIEFEETTFTIE